MAFPSSECPIRCLICGTNYIVENINTFFYPPILLTVSSLRVGIMHFHTVYEKKYDFHCRPLRYSKDHFILPLYQLKLVLISCLAGETLNFSQWWASFSHLPSPHHHEAILSWKGKLVHEHGLVIWVGWCQLWCSLLKPTWLSWSRGLHPLLSFSKVQSKAHCQQGLPNVAIRTYLCLFWTPSLDLPHHLTLTAF